MTPGIKQSLDQQEIRGITAKILWYIIYATATVCCFVAGSYFAIRIQITQLVDKNTEQDQNMNNISNQANKTDLEVDEINKRIDDLRTMLYQQKK